MPLQSSSSSFEPEQQRAAELRLTEDELSAVLNEAISRQSQAERPPERVTSLADALDIARQLSIPEEHVLAAAQEVQRRRLRELRRGFARGRRKGPFIAATSLAVIVALGVLLTGFSLAGVVTGIIALLPALYLGWRWLAAPISNTEADAVELPPVPGRCRVCWSDAATPRSTFCAEHQYQAPGGSSS